MLIFSLQNFSVHHMFWPLRPLPVCGMHRISGCRDLDTRRSLALFRGKYHQLYIAYKIITCFWSFQGLFTYLYVVSILFLLYVFCFLLHEYSCCGGPPAQPTVRNAYFHVSKPSVKHFPTPQQKYVHIFQSWVHSGFSVEWFQFQFQPGKLGMHSNSNSGLEPLECIPIPIPSQLECIPFQFLFNSELFMLRKDIQGNDDF